MSRTALIKTTTASQLNCAEMSVVKGIEITSTEPTGTTVRYVTKVDDGTWKKFNPTSNAWENVATQVLTAASVLSEGNTKAELQALTSTLLATFAGNKINFGVAMSADETAADVPSIEKIVINGQTSSTVTQTIVASDVIQMAATSGCVEISTIEVEKTELNGGIVTVQASTQDASEAWSDYVGYETLLTTPATAARAIKFRAILNAPTPGTSQATITSVAIKHRTDNIAVFAEGEGICVTQTYNFAANMTRAHLMVKHPIVADTEVKAYITLRAQPISVKDEVLGTGTGAQQTVTLKHTSKLASHNFKLCFDGIAQTSGYAFSSTDGKVTYTAPVGAVVTVDYTYNWDKETFVEMSHDATYADKSDNNLVDDQFNYTKVADTDPSGDVSAIKVTLNQLKGTVTGEVLGTGTGSLQSFKLAHNAKSESITVTPAAAVWTYKESTKTLFVTAANGAEIKASYKWVAETNYLESVACIWNK